jgi:hypothetical protein
LARGDGLGLVVAVAYLTMYDSIAVSAIPRDAKAVAGYVDGRWPNFQQMCQMFPDALHVSIATSPGSFALVLDVETGDATPEQAPPWVERMRSLGEVESWVYCNRSTWPLVIEAFTQANVAPPRYWIATADNNPIPPPGADACQYAQGGSGSYDISSWPAPAPNYVEDSVIELSEKGPNGEPVILAVGAGGSTPQGHLLKITLEADPKQDSVIDLTEAIAQANPGWTLLVAP